MQFLVWLCVIPTKQEIGHRQKGSRLEPLGRPLAKEDGSDQHCSPAVIRLHVGRLCVRSRRRRPRQCLGTDGWTQNDPSILLACSNDECMPRMLVCTYAHLCVYIHRGMCRFSHLLIIV